MALMALCAFALLGVQRSMFDVRCSKTSAFSIRKMPASLLDSEK